MAQPKTDREMILDPDSWPKWPILPLVRRGRDVSCAIIYGDPGKDGQVLFVEGANMYTGKDSWKNGVLRQVDDVLADGWVVD